MVETITPVVHGGRRSPYWTSVSLHVLGAAMASAAFGAVVGAAGGLLGAPWVAGGLWVLASIALMYALREGLKVPIPVFDRHRQVPEWWRTFYSPPVAALLYGLGLGVGFFTFLTFGTFVVVTAGAFLSGHAGTGALICLPFGFARALTVLAAAGVATAEDGAGVVERIDQTGNTATPRIVNALVLLALAALIATTA